MKKTSLALFIALSTTVFQPGCARSEEGGAPPETGAPAAHAGVSTPGGTTGTVIETMDSGGYTYVHVDMGSQKIWAAAPAFSVAVGDKVTVPTGTPMPNFHSKTLDRTFDVVYFVPGVVVGGSGAAAPQSPHPEIPRAEPGVALDLSGIDRAEGGKTVAEIFDGGADLAGKEVIVRGKVTKYLPQIMGTNFLHVSDGTKSAAGNDDLTVTSQQTASVGDLVTVRGILNVDKDFGFNYRYEFIIEDAAITRE
ncbi:MAG TPA: DNA-binding protein [Myxococcota bacterium]